MKVSITLLSYDHGILRQVLDVYKDIVLKRSIEKNRQIAAANEAARKLQEAEPGKEPGRDLRKETLAQVLRKELPLLATAHRAQDILSLLRLAKEFDLLAVSCNSSFHYLGAVDIATRVRAADAGVVIVASGRTLSAFSSRRKVPGRSGEQSSTIC